MKARRENPPPRKGSPLSAGHITPAAATELVKQSKAALLLRLHQPRFNQFCLTDLLDLGG